jgi:hypothetical protein
VRILRRFLRYTLAIALVLVPTAQADRKVIYGISDANFTSAWQTMAPRISSLRISQIGVWARYHCAADSDDWMVRGIPDDLGNVPESQPVLLTYVGAVSCTPRSKAERRQYAQALRLLVDLYPNIREVQVWNEPDLDAFWFGTVRDYVRLVAVVHDRLRGTFVRVLGPGFSPGGWLDARNTNFGLSDLALEVARFYRSSRRTRPLLEGIALHPYWGYGREKTAMAAAYLNATWKGLPQATPRRGLRFWWTETGRDSTPPMCELGLYYDGSDRWRPSTTSPEDQAARVRMIATRARTDPYVAADFNYELDDDPNLSRWQSGLFYVSGEPKPAFYAFQTAIRQGPKGRRGSQRPGRSRRSTGRAPVGSDAATARRIVRVGWAPSARLAP